VTTLNPPQPVENDGKVEVLEFFGYGCIHCANLEPKLEAWSKKQLADVKLRRVPVAFASRSIDSIPKRWVCKRNCIKKSLTRPMSKT
jgi:thiol-disulfide isomerase/thioredoxin